LVRETDGNGFVTQIDLLDTGNTWHNAVWAGTDTSAPGSPVNFVVSFSATAYLVKGVRIHVDTDHDPEAYEEIDAVRLLSDDASTTAGTAPAAADDSFSVDEDSSHDSYLLSDITNSAGYPLVFAVSVTPSHGSVALDLNGTPDDFSDDFLTYTPDPDYHGTDSFTWTVTDIFGQSDSA